MNHSFPQNLQHHLRSMILIILMPLEGLGLSRLKMELNQQSLFYNTQIMEHDNDKFWRLRQFWQSFKAIIEKVIKTISKSFVLLRLF